MKNLLFFLLLGNTLIITAQIPCKGNLQGDEFNANKIKTYFLPQGHKFKAIDQIGLQVPYPPVPNNPFQSTIGSGAPWIGGYHNGTLYMAGQQYINNQRQDYYTGPLDSNGMKYLDECQLYDRVWNVFREDVLKHVADYHLDGKIDDTIASIFGWPAEGNPFFSTINGFDLPKSHKGGWAPFDDLNQNGKYEPQLGEYPVAYLKGKLTRPEQIMWMVFNDQGSHLYTNGKSLGFELQLTVFGYYCKDNPLLNHSLFNSYKIINQSDVTLDSLFFGHFHDYQIGYDDDDYVGCDSTRATEFAYNADEFDGEMIGQGYIGYGPHPPIQSFTYLSHPVYSFIKQTTLQSPQTSVEYYRMMTGRWRSGAPITIGGDGQGTNPDLETTRYIYHGDPRIPTSWNELSVGIPSSRTQTISSVNLHKLQPEEQVTIECVYAFHQDTSLSHLEQFDVMESNLDMMAEMALDMDQFCTPFQVCTEDDCVWPGDLNHDLIVDHRDLLYWGVTNSTTGPTRNGLINWRGHYADDWSKVFDDGTNAKHQDADGDGNIDENDVKLNLTNFSKTTPDYSSVDFFPVGNELAIVSEPIDKNGNIGFVNVISKLPLHDLYGIAFELDFDTFYYKYDQLIQSYPLDTLGVCFIGNQVEPEYSYYPKEGSGDTRYSFVGTSHENFTIPEGFNFIRIPFGLIQRYQLPPKDLPNQIVLRLKNLIGINKEGKEIILGADPLVIENPFNTAVPTVQKNKVSIFPNPAHDEVMIVSDLATDVEIINIQGKRIRTISASALQMPVRMDDLVPGIYFLRFKNSYGLTKLIVH